MDVKIQNLFEGVQDPRVERTKKHPLESILYIVFCGTMAGVESWIGFQDYAEQHEEVLKEFIDLPNGVPSHDTIGRVIEALNPQEFERSFDAFVKKLSDQAKDLIAIDGKTIRGSFDHKKKN